MQLDDDDDDTMAFRRVLQRDAIPTTSKQCLTVQTQQNCAHFATSYTLGSTTTDHHSCARRSISSSNELPSGVREAWRNSFSSLAHPNMMSWSPASTSTSSLPTCPLPAISELCSGRNRPLQITFLAPVVQIHTQTICLQVWERNGGLSIVSHVLNMMPRSPAPT